MHSLLVGLVLASSLLLASPSVAHADIIDESPDCEPCPRGTTYPERGHGCGCVAAPECSPEAGCEYPGWTCEEVSLCGGAPCEPGTECPWGEACDTRHRCVAPPAPESESEGGEPTPTSSRDGCGCHMGQSAPSPALLLGGMAAAAFLLLRRRH